RLCHSRSRRTDAYPLALHDALPICLKAANEAGKATIVMVTHDAYCASYAKQVYFLKDGRIQCCLNRQESRKAFYDEIMAMLASIDRKSTRLNSSHVSISYAGFCLNR